MTLELPRTRAQAIRRARAWYTGENLTTDSGAAFWAEKSPSKEYTETGPVPVEYRVHVPVAEDIALTAADFLVGDGVELTTPDEEARDLVTELLVPHLGQVVELASGIGEGWIRLGWDDDVPVVELPDARSVEPTWRYGRLVKAKVTYGLPAHNGSNWRHVEIYEPGQVRHELYKAGATVTDNNGTTKENLTAAPLSDHPDTADLDEVVPNPSALEDRLLLVCVKNRPPITGGSWGAADTAGFGAESMMAAADAAMTSLMRDVRLGRARIVVDESMLSRAGQLIATGFDTSSEVFAPLNIGGSALQDTRQAIQGVQFNIRAEEHLSVAREAVRRAVGRAGYSPESLVTEQSSLPESAASRRLREARSLRTTGAKADRYRPSIVEAAEVLIAIAADLDEISSSARPEVQVEFRDPISPDLAERASTITMLRAAKVMSVYTSVQELHPDWDDDRVDTEVKRLAEESAADIDLGGLL